MYAAVVTRAHGMSMQAVDDLKLQMKQYKICDL